jgi:Polyketide cyclase / dehydrase and lipid transport
MIPLVPFAHRRPRPILALWLAIIGLGAVLAVNLPGSEKAGGAAQPHAKAAPAQQSGTESAMPDEQDTIVIEASAHDVREVLLEVGQLDQWNPAFVSITGSNRARAGQPHPIQVRGGLAGEFQYDDIQRDRIESSWRVPGFRETNYWQLDPAAANSTLVTHGFVQKGPLAEALRGATEDVARQRVARLKARVEARAASRGQATRQG